MALDISEDTEPAMETAGVHDTVFDLTFRSSRQESLLHRATTALKGLHK